MFLYHTPIFCVNAGLQFKLQFLKAQGCDRFGYAIDQKKYTLKNLKNILNTFYDLHLLIFIPIQK